MDVRSLEKNNAVDNPTSTRHGQSACKIKEGQEENQIFQGVVIRKEKEKWGHLHGTKSLYRGSGGADFSPHPQYDKVEIVSRQVKGTLYYMRDEGKARASKKSGNLSGGHL